MTARRGKSRLTLEGEAESVKESLKVRGREAEAGAASRREGQLLPPPEKRTTTTHREKRKRAADALGVFTRL